MSVSFSSPQNDALTLTQCLRYLKTELMQSDGETRGLNNFEEPSESTLPPWVLFIPIGHVRARVLAVYGHMHAFLCSCNKVLIKKKKSKEPWFQQLPPLPIIPYAINGRVPSARSVCF